MLSSPSRLRCERQLPCWQRIWQGFFSDSARRRFLAEAGKFFGGSGKSACRAIVHWDGVFAQAAISGLFAALRTRHDAERSVGKMAAILAGPQ